MVVMVQYCSFKCVLSYASNTVLPMHRIEPFCWCNDPAVASFCRLDQHTKSGNFILSYIQMSTV